MLDWERQYAEDLAGGVKRERREAGTREVCSRLHCGLATVLEEIRNTWSLEEASESQEGRRLEERAGLTACRHCVVSEGYYSMAEFLGTQQGPG